VTNAAAPKTETKDDDPIWIVVGKTADLGVIDEAVAKACGCSPGIIRLAEGFQNARGVGFGLKHLEANAGRVAQLKDLGLKSATQSIASVAANWTLMVRAQEAGRICVAQIVGGREIKMVLERFQKGEKAYWSVVTLIPGRRSKPSDVLFEKSTAE